MRALGKSAAAGLTAVALLGAGMGAAYADNLISDGDGPALNDSNLSLGTVACGAEAARAVAVAVVRRGDGDPNSFEDGSTATITVESVSGGVSADMQSAVITLPGDWNAKSNGYLSSAVSSLVSVTPTIAGAGSGSVTFKASGTNRRGSDFSRSDTMNVSWTAGPCSTNTAPSAPGAPVASASPTQGGFSLSWGASTDTQNNAVSYTLEGRDSDDAAWTQVASGLTATSHTFTAGEPAEGTWTYRVKAVETTTSPALSSGWSAGSLPVVVDRTGPNAPTASADRPAEYSSTTADWWKDTVTVSFASAGDKALVDGSAGSGVASVSDAQTFSATGPFSANGTATDAVGNVSEAAVFSGSVDATAPVVTLTCPTANVVKGSTASATWTASDEGSGLAGAASGQTPLDTSAIGTHTATVPAGTAADNVGHQSEAASCSYSVVYDFRGFFQPVDMSGVNVAKAGSAIPIKFSLNGYQGMDIIAAGFPTFTVTGTSVDGDVIEQTVTAGGSSLSYDADSDQYVYVWKTSKDWAGKRGTFSLKLNDGTTHTAQFSFKK